MDVKFLQRYIKVADHLNQRKMSKIAQNKWPALHAESHLKIGAQHTNNFSLRNLIENSNLVVHMQWHECESVWFESQFIEMVYIQKIYSSTTNINIKVKKKLRQFRVHRKFIPEIKRDAKIKYHKRLSGFAEIFV